MLSAVAGSPSFVGAKKATWRVPAGTRPLGPDDVGGVGGVPGDVVEGDAPDGIGDVELVLEAERQQVGSADEQEVVGDHVGIDGAGSGAEAAEERRLGLAGRGR